MKPRQTQAEQRANRLKAALKANIGRRKAQARARDAAAASAGTEGDPEHLADATALDDVAPPSGTSPEDG